MALHSAMPRRRESVGKALRKALGEEVVLPKIEPRKPGVSYLLNDRRLRLYQAVFNQPGVHLRELQRQLKIPLQSLRWHVSVLVSAGVLQQLGLGKRDVLFSPISTQATEVAMRALFRDSRHGPLLRLIAERGEVSVREMRESLGTYQQLVSARLKLLKALGLVESSGTGPRTRYRLAAGVPPGHEEASRAPREWKDELVALLRDQGLAPRVLSQSARKLTAAVDKGTEETELTFTI